MRSLKWLRQGPQQNNKAQTTLLQNADEVYCLPLPPVHSLCLFDSLYFPNYIALTERTLNIRLCFSPQCFNLKKKKILISVCLNMHIDLYVCVCVSVID